jgi:hypothetical protein
LFVRKLLSWKEPGDHEKGTIPREALTVRLIMGSEVRQNLG